VTGGYDERQPASYLVSRASYAASAGSSSDPAPVLLGLAGFDGKLKFLNPAWGKILDTRRRAAGPALRDLMQQHGQAPPRCWSGFWPRMASSRWNSACAAGTAHSMVLMAPAFDSEHQAIFIAGYDNHRAEDPEDRIVTTVL